MFAQAQRCLGASRDDGAIPALVPNTCSFREHHNGGEGHKDKRCSTRLFVTNNRTIGASSFKINYLNIFEAYVSGRQCTHFQSSQYRKLAHDAVVLCSPQLWRQSSVRCCHWGIEGSAIDRRRSANRGSPRMPSHSGATAKCTSAGSRYAMA